MPDVLAGIDPLASHYFDWIADGARESQLPPRGEWFIWLLLAGRGFGKTRTAAEDAAFYALEHPGARIAIVAETFSDGRDICIEGDAGLMSVLPNEAVAAWNRSLGQLVLANGARFDLYSGDKPDQLRGPSHHRIWCDELAKYRYAQETWDQAMLGLRLTYTHTNGQLEQPKAVVTTTPRPIPLLKQLVADEDVAVTVGSTYDNIENLAASFRAQILKRYEGTRLGRQELHAHILDDVPGALWQRKQIDDTRTTPGRVPDFARVVVAIDPAMTSGEDADETGIVVAARGVDGRGYVLDDKTCRLSPDGWARRAIGAYYSHSADRVVAEVNNGGEMVAHTLRTVDPLVSYKAVHASRGKRVRAEPVAALYEQGKVSHVGTFADMEDQMANFVPDEMTTSPDRVDALVWALTELMIQNKGTRRMKVFR